MALFDDIMDGLRTARDVTPDSETFEAKATVGEHEVEVIAQDFDRLGIKIHKLRVRAQGESVPPQQLNQRLQSQGERLASRETGPFKHLKITEIDGRLGGGILRTDAKAMERGYFYEAELKGGDEIEIRRLKRSPDGAREDIGFHSSDETFPDMVDTLKDGLSGTRED